MPLPENIPPILQLGLEFWKSRCKPDLLPARNDFSPPDLPRNLLPHVMLIDVEPGSPPRFRWRLVGTHITSVMQRDATGAYWDELYSPSILKMVSRAALEVLATRQPVYTREQAPVPGRDFIPIQSIDMPLASDGKNIDMLLTICLAN